MQERLITPYVVIVQRPFPFGENWDSVKPVKQETEEGENVVVFFFKKEMEPSSSRGFSRWPIVWAFIFISLLKQCLDFQAQSPLLMGWNLTNFRMTAALVFLQGLNLPFGSMYKRNCWRRGSRINAQERPGWRKCYCPSKDPLIPR